MEKEIIFRILEVFSQLALVILSGFTLFIWKFELRGRDRYNYSKELLSYLKGVSFLIYSGDGDKIFQVYLNDILIKGDKFYSDLNDIANKKVCFDYGIMGLFSHINARSDFFLPIKIREALEELTLGYAEEITKNSETALIHIMGGKILNKFSEKEDGVLNIVFSRNNDADLTVEKYFKKWEKLLKELRGSV